MKTYNFFAGPAILPQSVLKQSANAIHNFANMDLSIIEISHRSPQFMKVMDEARAHVKTLLQLSDDYEVLFLTGGASSQFYMSALNFLNKDQKAGYIDTGTWSAKAIKEAKGFGNIDIIASSKDKGFSYIPKNIDIPSDIQYLHYTSNNTIYGTQFNQIPQTEVPIICDMSSDIFSRRIHATDFSMIYAGAQKNMGPAGVTLVVINKNRFNKANRSIPTLLDYDTHISKGSMFNTPPVFPIYVSMLTLRWIIDNGGLESMEERNNEKAKVLYEAIDGLPLFKGIVNHEDRSKMNVCFKMQDDKLEDKFLQTCLTNKCLGVKGHRSVGGFRASIYNAMPLEGVQKLVEIMGKFDKEHGG